MTEHIRLLDLAETLEQGAHSLAVFALYVDHSGPIADDVRQAAVDVAMALMPDESNILNLGGIDTRRLGHAAASSLLRLASLARTRGAMTAADAAAATQLARELLIAGNHLRIEAAGLG